MGANDELAHVSNDWSPWLGVCVEVTDTSLLPHPLTGHVITRKLRCYISDMQGVQRHYPIISQMRRKTDNQEERRETLDNCTMRPRAVTVACSY